MYILAWFENICQIEGRESTIILVYQNNFGKDLEYKCNSLIEANVNENVK